MVGNSPLHHLVVQEATPSTNTALSALLDSAPEEWPHISALATDHQTAGKGRAGRSWETPRGAALTVSFATWPEVSETSLPWVGLVAAQALVDVCRDVGLEAAIKWPNDVVVNGAHKSLAGWGKWRKCVGILTEAHPSGAVIVGVGLNVSQDQHELPVPHATSLLQSGATEINRGTLLGLVAVRLAQRLSALERDTKAARREVMAACVTLGNSVVVTHDDSVVVSGKASRLGQAGELIVTDSRGQEHPVFAGDVQVRMT